MQGRGSDIYHHHHIYIDPELLALAEQQQEDEFDDDGGDDDGHDLLRGLGQELEEHDAVMGPRRRSAKRLGGGSYNFHGPAMQNPSLPPPPPVAGGAFAGASAAFAGAAAAGDFEDRLQQPTDGDANAETMMSSLGIGPEEAALLGLDDDMAPEETAAEDDADALLQEAMEDLL